MNFSLKFQKTGDTLPFEVVCNHDLFRYFADIATSKGENLFYFEQTDASKIEGLVGKLHNLLQKVNPITNLLISKTFDICADYENYLDQSYLNRIHAEWVKSQNQILNIDTIRFSQDKETSELGEYLHEQYPDEIRDIRIAEALDKLGYIADYEAINITIHELESVFDNQYLEFGAAGKWDIVDNPFNDTMITNNDITNFNFGYTYLGRQCYNKWEYFDSKLEHDDHYNYQALEFSFNINLSRPQTIPFSKEFLEWCTEHSIKPVGNQLPIANLVDIENNLFNYRKIIYRNLRDRNPAKIIIEE
jgi:hypothetical protein